MECLPEEPRLAALGSNDAFCHSVSEGLLTDFNDWFCFSEVPCLCTPGGA